MSTTPQIDQFRLAFPGLGGEQASYFDLTVLANASTPGVFPAGLVTDAWCVVRPLSIFSQSLPAGWYYRGLLYSTYEASSIAALPGMQSVLGAISASPSGTLQSALNSVNWLFGQYYSTGASTTAWQNVQGAIWQLMGSDGSPTGDIAGGDVGGIAGLTFAARTFGSTYVPDVGQPLAVYVGPQLFNNQGALVTQFDPLQPLFVITQAAKLGDFVWHDLNANGIQDADEPGIAGATVNLFRDLNNDGVVQPNEILATTVTAADGSYSFQGLTPGFNYQVQFVLPTGFDQGSPRQAGGNPAVDSDGPLSNVVVLAPGEYNQTLDAGFFQFAKLGDFVWNDLNRNGIQDANEPGLDGVVVRLLDANHQVIRTTVTGDNPATPEIETGYYEFAGLTPGVGYYVEFVTPTGFVPTGRQVGGSTAGNDSDGLKSDLVILSSGEFNPTIDAGFYVAPTASLGNFVWEDLNANGLQDDGPTGVAGVTVRLIGGGADGVIGTADDTEVSTVTDLNGFYLFTGLNPGEEYQVVFVRPTEFISFTVRDAGSDDANDSDADLAGVTPIVVLGPDEFNQTIDAGLLKPARLGDFVWRDLNGNGLQDGDETGVNGVTVTLTGTDALGNPVVLTQQTTGNGGYLFDNLVPGTYTVTFTAPDGLAFTQANAGGNDALDSDADPVTGAAPAVTLGSGQSNLTIDAGLVGTGIQIIKFVKDQNGVDQNANSATGPTLVVGSVATFTYVVTNTGNVSLANVQVLDDNGTPLFGGDDFAPTFTGGDDNGNGLLDIGESWTYTASSTVVPGQYTNIATVTGTPVYPQAPGTPAGTPPVLVPNLPPPTDDDPANYFGEQRDFGDLPAPLYNAVLGAYHVFTDEGLRLGARIDAEPAAQPNASATGDDLNGVDDEDGITLPAALFAGSTASFALSITNATASAAELSAFFDWNRDGVFDDSEVVRMTIGAGFFGPLALNVDVPAGAVVGEALGARFRLTTVEGIDAATPAPDGEVEDYLVTVGAQRASLGDFVWHDLNADGIQQPDEPGIAGATVTLLLDGVAVGTATTDAAGFYQFVDLAPGAGYQVRFDTPAGFSAASPALQGSDAGLDSDGPLSGLVILAPGENNPTIDAGFYKFAAIGDFVWEDKNGNGVQDDGEVGIGGVVVRLFDCLDPNPDAAPIRTTVTAADGSYSFTDLKPGQYKVQFLTPDGFVQTTANVEIGPNGDLKDSDAGLNGFTGCYTLASGETNNTVDAGFYRPAQLGDRVWEDANRNGVQDDGEVGVSGVKVTLFDCITGTPIAHVFTDADGLYLFTGLPPGQYKVGFELPAGFIFTVRDAGADDEKDSDADPVTGLTDCVTLESGSDVRSLDAGLVRALAGIDIEKATNGRDADAPTGPLLLVGTLATFTYEVRNTGNLALANVMVRDDNGTPDDLTDDFAVTNFVGGDVNGNGLLDIGEVWTFSADRIVTAGQYTNIGVVTGTPVDSQGNPVPGVPNPTDSDPSNHFGVQPGIQIDKVTNGTDGGVYAVGAPIVWTYTVTNTGNVALSGVTVTDDQGELPVFVGGDTNGDGKLDLTETWIFQASGVAVAGAYQNIGTATGTFVDDDGNTATPTSNDPSNYTGKVVSIDIEKLVRGEWVVPGNGGGEGLTPGFWKTHSQFGPAPLAGWPETGYSPLDSYNAIFGTSVSGSPTLLQALNAGGGGVNALLRHSAAALLNAANPNVDYAFSVAQVIAQTQTAINSGNSTLIASTKNLFEAQNELGANLATPAVGGGSTVVTPDVDADLPGTGPQIPVGGKAVFTYLVTNTGEVPLANVQVTDDRIANLVFVGGDSNNDGLLDLNEIWVYTAHEAVVGSSGVVNTGTVTGTALGVTVSDQDLAHYNGTAVVQGLGDFVWLDRNGNGLQDGDEPGIAGVRVVLVGAGADGVFGTGDDTTATTLTDGDGYYQFTNLIAGQPYQVQFVAPAGLVFTTRDAGDDSRDSDAGPDGRSQVVTLAPGEFNPTIDAGLYAPASLGDRVWLDRNANGQQDANEPGIAGVTVNLFDCITGEQVATTVTDAQGLYNFTQLRPGQYKVQFEAPEDFYFTRRDVGNDATDSDAEDDDGDNPGFTGCYVLLSGETNNTVDAGLFQFARLGDFVWEDLNGNGIQDANEPGIEGVVVKLRDAMGNVVEETTTDENGEYSFDVLPGTYSLHFLTPEGFFITGRDRGTSDALDSDIDAAGNTGLYTVLSGQENLTIDAGYFRLASIGDRVFLDCNNNGIQDQNEAGVAGVTVRLLNASSQVIATTTTDTEGNYLFSSLVPGQYAVQFVAPTGFRFSARDQGSDDTKDSDADLTTGRTVFTTLTSGEVDLTWDAGLVPNPICISLDFTGNTATSGTFGNTRTYTNSLTGLSVTASAWSQDKGTNTFHTAFLGAYTGGLGVTDRSEGSGGNLMHTVDNNGLNNYIVFQFNKQVTVDRAFLGYISGDSDAQFWIGNVNSPITALNNTILNSLTTEVNNSTLTSGTRWADINAGNLTGNVLIVAARLDQSDDRFKIQKLDLCVQPSVCLPEAPRGSIGDRVWCDTNGNGIQDTHEPGIAGVTVRLLNATGQVVATTTTNTNGNYVFSNLLAGDYRVEFVQPSAFGGFTLVDRGSNDNLDSDASPSNGRTGLISLAPGQHITNVDAGFVPPLVNLTYHLGGNTHTDGPDGNTRSLTVGGVSVTASAWSRTKGTNTWQKAWLGAYSGGQGVTDSSEGSGSGVRHTLDNDGRDNFIIYRFSEAVTVDKLLLGYVYKDSDISVWIGNTSAPITSMSNSVLNSMAFTEVNTGGSSARWADINAGHVSGNTLIVAARIGQHDDYVKIDRLVVQVSSKTITPIVIDLDGDGIQTVALDDAGGKFDLLGTGEAIASGWISGDDGFLAVDLNGNGRIDDISELFGGNGKGEGFAKLRAFDSNGDGLVDTRDERFGELLVWRDLNGNHQTDDGELMTLAQAGIASLSVDYHEHVFYDAQGNLHVEHAQATTTDGRKLGMTDVFFAVSQDDLAAAGVQLPTLQEILASSGTADDLLADASAQFVGPMAVSKPGEAAGLVGEGLEAYAAEAAEVLRRMVEQANNLDYQFVLP